MLWRRTRKRGAAPHADSTTPHRPQKRRLPRKLLKYGLPILLGGALGITVAKNYGRAIGMVVGGYGGKKAVEWVWRRKRETEVPQKLKIGAISGGVALGALQPGTVIIVTGGVLAARELKKRPELREKIREGSVVVWGGVKKSSRDLRERARMEFERQRARMREKSRIRR